MQPNRNIVSHSLMLLWSLAYGSMNISGCVCDQGKQISCCASRPRWLEIRFRHAQPAQPNRTPAWFAGLVLYTCVASQVGTNCLTYGNHIKHQSSHKPSSFLSSSSLYSTVVSCRQQGWWCTPAQATPLAPLSMPSYTTATSQPFH